MPRPRKTPARPARPSAPRPSAAPAAPAPRTKPASSARSATSKAEPSSATKTPARRAATRPAPTPPVAPTTPTTTPPPDGVSARVEALTGVFTALGARDPERWARAHVEHGHDQIGRFVFLKGLWGRVARDGRFLDRMRRDPGDSRDLVERLLMSGADEADLVQLVRAMQVQLLVDFSQILDDPSDNDEGIRWGLWRMDRRGLPLWQLSDLRLDVLEVDPADDV